MTDLGLSLREAFVLREFIEQPAEPQYGFDLSERLHTSSGTIHATLIKFERMGLVESTHEDIDPAQAGRPARRLYRLTTHGAVRARVALAELSERLRPPVPATRPRASTAGGVA